MSEASLYQVITGIGTIVATGFTFSKIFFRRVDTIEKVFKESIDKLNDNLSRIDKNLAVNTALIDQVIKKGNKYGN